MCTAITYTTKDHYFGRNLDFEHDFGECVTVTPRNFPFIFRQTTPMPHHYAMIGMATVSDGYPLYHDATNEYGVSMAGLYFPESAVYQSPKPRKTNLAPFELIPWLLGHCKSAQEAVDHLKDCKIADLHFSDAYPSTPLHWILADRDHSYTLEPRRDGLHIYDNPIGILTNEPPFDYHLTILRNYRNITREDAPDRFSNRYPLPAFSRGMGGIGLPGDLSSVSRFVRAAFTKLNSASGSSESESISQVFHILGSVAQQQGCVKVGNAYEKTIYTSCCNATKGIYYYTTYENSQITGVQLAQCDLEGTSLITYPLITGQHIHMQN